MTNTNEWARLYELESRDPESLSGEELALLDVLRALLFSRAAVERRRATRLSWRQQMIIEHQGITRAVSCVDVAAGGMRLVSDERIDANRGDVVQLIAVGESGGAWIAVELCCACVRQDGAHTMVVLVADSDAKRRNAFFNLVYRPAYLKYIAHQMPAELRPVVKAPRRTSVKTRKVDRSAVN